MGNRNRAGSYREAMRKVLGTKCVNCGSEEYIEYHHIVPIHLGGIDKLENMVALCNRCHKVVHSGQHIRRYRNTSHDGRPRKVTKEEVWKALDLFFSGSISSRKCKQLLGLSQTSQIHVSPYLKEYMIEKNIIEFKNTVDVAATTGCDGLYEGRLVGHVKYKDGMIEDIHYKESGLNDVEYVRRAQ